MIKFKYYLILLITFILLTTTLSSCRKWFDDGPHYSLRSIKQRLEGKWEFIYVRVDGVDSTVVFREKIGCYLNIPSINNKGSNICTISNYDNTKEYSCFCGYSKTDDTRVLLHIAFKSYNIFPNAYTFGPFGSVHGSSWYIKRLTKDELWIDVNGAFWPPNINMYYYIKLNKIMVI